MTTRPNNNIHEVHQNNRLMDIITSDLIIFIVLMGLLSYFKVRLFQYETPDYTTFLKPWYETLSKGGFAAFKDSFYDYNPLSMLISI
jgi:hypothetical protein